MKRIIILWLVTALLLGIVFAGAALAEEKAVFNVGANWQPPPAYHGNHFAPGGVGGAYWWVYEPLFVFIPDTWEMRETRLAVSYEDTPEAFTVTLREGVVWHDGTPFTSKDVLSTFKLGYLKAWLIWKYLDRIETPDDLTVKFVWKTPIIFAGPIVARETIRWPDHIYGKWADQVDFTIGRDDGVNKTVTMELLGFKPEKPIGTGPFMLTAVTTSEMILEKHQDHYAADIVDFDEVHIVRWTANEVIWPLLKAGKMDASHVATPPDLTSEIMKAQPGMSMALPTDFGSFTLAMNLRPEKYQHPALASVEFRQVIAYALDREQLAKASYYYGLPVTEYAHNLLESMKDPWLTDWLLENMTHYTYDPAKAEALLTEIGCTKGPDGFWRDPDGKTIEIEAIAHAGYSDWVLAIDNIATQLTNFGIKVEARPTEGAIYWGTLTAGDFQWGIEWASHWRPIPHPLDGYFRAFDPTGDTSRRVGWPETKFGALTAHLVDQLGTEPNVARQERIVEMLAWMHNEYVASLPFVEKRLMLFNLEGVRVKGWPAAEDPIWSTAAGGIERCYTELMIEGIIKAVR